MMINKDLIYAAVALICSVLLSFSLTPAVRVFAFKIGAIDVPADNRRMHKKPTPRVGGLAIYLSFCITCLLFCDISKELVVMLAGGFLIASLGVFDDVFRLSAWLKFFIQIAIAVGTYFGGIRIDWISVGNKYAPLGWLAIPLTVLWIVGLSNAFNFVDGLDGLSCGLSTISSISILCVVLLQGDLSYAIVALILIGSCFGFLPFNRHPARIFMGDTGALFLGYTLAVVSIQGTFKMHTVLSVLVPLFIFAVPLADTVFAVIRRLLSGKSPFAADRGHFHHRLVDMGFTQKETVKILYSICGMFGLVAVFMCDNIFPHYKLVKSISIIVVALVIFFIILAIMKNPVTRLHSGLFEEEETRSREFEIERTVEKVSVENSGNGGNSDGDKNGKDVSGEPGGDN